MLLLHVERLFAAAVLLTTIVVAVTTIHHGDLGLGMLVLCGKFHEILSHRAHAASEDSHLIVHKSFTEKR